MRAQQKYILVAVAASYLRSIFAFAPSHIGRSLRRSDVCFPPLLIASPPIISNWRFDSSKGTITGTVTNHPTIPDGDRITTSQVKNPGGINENLIVETKSGSKYKLSNVALGAIFPAMEARMAKEKEAVAQNNSARLEAEKKAKVQASITPKLKQATQQKSLASNAVGKSGSRALESSISYATLRKLAKSKFSLTGTTVGANGKYLLAANPRQSSGRSAKIWTAYLCEYPYSFSRF